MMSNDIYDRLDMLQEERDQARAERDALRAYARALELKWWNEVNDRSNGHPDTNNLVEELRTEHNVTELMDATH